MSLEEVTGRIGQIQAKLASLAPARGSSVSAAQFAAIRRDLAEIKAQIAAVSEQVRGLSTQLAQTGCNTGTHQLGRAEVGGFVAENAAGFRIAQRGGRTENLEMGIAAKVADRIGCITCA